MKQQKKSLTRSCLPQLDDGKPGNSWISRVFSWCGPNQWSNFDLCWGLSSHPGL